MTILRAQHHFQGASGLPRDQFVNTFYFKTPAAAVDADFVAITAALKNFYTFEPVGTVDSIQKYLSVNAVGSGTVKFYDMQAAAPRPLLATKTYGFSASSGETVPSLPQEVALCLSYSADAEAGVPLASLRGRIFIGPLNQNALSPSTGAARPHPGLQDAISQAATGLHFEITITDSMEWGLWSHKLASYHKITKAYVDNEWDTQRRRSSKSDSRVAVTGLVA